MKPRILLADDHALLLDVLAQFLCDEFEVVGAADNGVDLLAAAARLHPDLFILDLSMPGLDGVQALQRLRPQLPRTRLLVLTMYNDRSYLRAALAAGADGYALKDLRPEDLIAAIWQLLRGEPYVDPRLGPATADPTAPAPAATREGSGALTERQREVLRRLAAGASAKQIADDLGITMKTVEFHRTCIGRQLGLRSTAALTRYALEHGLVP